MKIMVKYSKENYKSYTTYLDELSYFYHIKTNKITLSIDSDMYSSLVLVPRHFESPYKYIS